MAVAPPLPYGNRRGCTYTFSKKSNRDRRYPQQPTGYHAILVGLSDLLSPNPPIQPLVRAPSLTFAFLRNLNTAPCTYLSANSSRIVVLLAMGLALAWRTLYPNPLLLIHGVPFPSVSLSLLRLDISPRGSNYTLPYQALFK